MSYRKGSHCVCMVGDCMLRCNVCKKSFTDAVHFVDEEGVGVAKGDFLVMDPAVDELLVGNLKLLGFEEKL